MPKPFRDPSRPQPDKPTADADPEQTNKEAEETIEDLQEDAGEGKKIAGGSPGDAPNPAEPLDDESKPPR